MGKFFKRPSLLNRWRVLSLNFGFGVRRDQGWRCSSAVRPGCCGGGVFAAVSAVSEVLFSQRSKACRGSVASVPRRSASFSRPSQLFLEGQAASSRVTVSNNRSVMPLDVLGRTRATLKESACFSPPVRKDRVTAEPPSWLGLGTAMIPMNQESLVGASH